MNTVQGERQVETQSKNVSDVNNSKFIIICFPFLHPILLSFHSESNSLSLFIVTRVASRFAISR